jgi:hypothetical protein
MIQINEIEKYLIKWEDLDKSSISKGLKQDFVRFNLLVH